MKNININEKKIKDITKRSIALATSVFTLAILSGCSKKLPEGWPSEFAYIEQDYNKFDKFWKTIIKDGQPTIAYKGSNIALAINKENFEVKEYIFNETVISADVYDLLTGYLIVDTSVFSLPVDNNVANWDIIDDNNYIVDFVNIGDYIEGEQLKEYYTLEEIRNLEPAIVNSLKKSIEYNSLKVR